MQSIRLFQSEKDHIKVLNHVIIVATSAKNQIISLRKKIKSDNLILVTTKRYSYQFR
jgi:hypothetical protein